MTNWYNLMVFGFFEVFSKTVTPAPVGRKGIKKEA